MSFINYYPKCNLSDDKTSFQPICGETTHFRDAARLMKGEDAEHVPKQSISHQFLKNTTRPSNFQPFDKHFRADRRKRQNTWLTFFTVCKLCFSLILLRMLCKDTSSKAPNTWKTKFQRATAKTRISVLDSLRFIDQLMWLIRMIKRHTDFDELIKGLQTGMFPSVLVVYSMQFLKMLKLWLMILGWSTDCLAEIFCLMTRL